MKKAEILLKGVQKNISLKPYTTFKIGGRAKYFFIAKNKEDFILAVKLAKRLRLPFFVLGEGSNLLVSDKGFNGLVIKVKNQKIESDGFAIRAGTGVLLGQLLSLSLRSGFSGLEWAVGVPGTVGGAIHGNAGAFGKSIADNLGRVEVYNTKTKRIKFFSRKDCNFGYRESIFKKNTNLIILEAELRLRRCNKKVIQKTIKKYLKHKKETQPLSFSSAGSIFKNPKKVSAGFLIDECGLKGKKIGGAKISEKHGNFIINLGNAKAKDVKKLITLIKKEAKNQFKVILKEEIQYLGFQN